MSDYGKLFARVSGIREELKRLLPGAKLEWLATSREEAANHAQRVADEAAVHARKVANAIDRWAELDREMSKCDDVTGMYRRDV